MTDDVGVSTEIQVDDETRAALLLFNERVEASAAKERGRKRVAKAERAKAEAAKVVRRVNDDPDATAEQKAEAEAAYKAASDNFQVVQANPLASEKRPAKAKPVAEEAEATPQEDTEATPQEDTEATPQEEAEATPQEEAAAPTEVSADEEAPATDQTANAAEEPSESE